MVKALGADQVIDYTKEDFSSSEERYDVIFDTVAKFPKSQYSKVLALNGTYVSMAKLNTKEGLENLVYIKELIEAGHIKSVIDAGIHWKIRWMHIAMLTRGTKKGML